jgi:hypothetical protein
MVDINVHIDASGPVFNGMAAAEVERFASHVRQTLGDIGVTMIRAYLETQYMYLGHHGGTPEFNPVPANAGFLQASIHTERQTFDSLLITDDPVTYGAWIEGIDPMNLVVWPHHRNPPPRRFPGYHTFRKISDSLDHMATSIAYRELPVYIQMMNS